jgi:uncharacterized protein DUF5671
MILRRLYLYVVSAASLALLVIGLVFLGDTALLFMFNDPSAAASRTALATFAAMTVVALPVWGVHIGFATRFARRDVAERASAIRRIYVYLACLLLSVGATVAIEFAAARVLAPAIDGAKLDGLGAAQAGWAAAVLLAFWALHFTMATRDRSVAGELDASVQLRRWYMYLALLIGLLTMLSGATNLIQVVWLDALGKMSANQTLSTPVAQLLAGFILWAFHARVVATRYIEEDRKSTLRALEGFIVVTVSIVAALIGASQILYFLLARLLGVHNPGGVGDDVLVGLAVPGSMLLVYGVAWFLITRRLARDAGTEEGERQAGIRRLYTNLAALVSLAAFAGGAAGALAVGAQAIEAPIIGVPAPPGWQDPLSLTLTLMLVGASVWVAHWRPAPWLAERQALSRRLYLWAALLISVLAILGSGIALLYVVLQQLFSTQPKLADTSNLAFGMALAVLVVAGVFGIYHWRVMHADARARPPKPEAEVATAPPSTHVTVVPAAVETSAPAPAPPAPAEVTPPGRRFILTVIDATDDDVHQALSGLPPQASYHLTPEEPKHQ